MNQTSSHIRTGRVTGGFATLLGVAASLYLLFGPIGRYTSTRVHTDGSRSSESGTTSGIDYLYGAEHADPALFFWALALLAVVLVGGYGVYSANRVVVWAVAIPLVVFTILSIASIGLFVAPVAILYLVSAASFSSGPSADEP